MNRQDGWLHHLLAFTRLACLAIPVLGAASGGEGKPALEVGQVLAHRLRLPGGDDPGGLRALFIRVGQEDAATMCFDTGTLNYAAMWTGGFLDMSRTHHLASKGLGDPIPVGTMRFTAPNGPGWSAGADLADPRSDPALPLPRSAGRYQGYYRHGARTVLSYRVGGCEVLECPGLTEHGAGSVFTRTVRVAASDQPLCLLLFSAKGATTGGVVASAKAGSATAAMSTRQGPATGQAVWSDQHDAADAWCVAAAVTSQPGATLSYADGKAMLHLPARPAPVTLRIALWQGAAAAGRAAGAAAVAGVLAGADPIPDLLALTKGGPTRWGPGLVTSGKLSDGPGAYVVDTLTLPNHAWGTGMRLGGVDFLPDGNLAVCSIAGDVWVVSGIDTGLRRLTWRRFATGLYEPLGLRVVDGRILVRGRDQITRLHDLDGDGEADFHENVFNDDIASDGYHAFAFDLQSDQAGNLYYLRCGHKAETAGAFNSGLIRVAADGSSAALIANGLKAANGLGISPTGAITVCDNEGDGIVDTPIYQVRPGAFYGFRHTAKAGATPLGKTQPPLLSLARTFDNSGGGQVWATGGAFGPLEGLMLHTSYGQARMLAVLVQPVGDQTNGAGYTLPLDFSSGVMRARCSPRDGQIYVCGQKGWDTKASAQGGLYRVRHSGRPYPLPISWRAERTGIVIGFAVPLDAKQATEAGNYSIATGPRGAAKPAKPLPISAVQLSADGKTLTIACTPIITPQLLLTMKVTTADGTTVPIPFTATINALP